MSSEPIPEIPAPRSVCRWWGRFEIPEGQAARWQIGPLVFTAVRRPQEWLLCHRSSGDPLDTSCEIACAIDPLELGAKGKPLRIISSSMPEFLVLTPRLGDRPIVHRPEMTFHLLPDDEICLYVSTPLWIEVATDDPPQTLLDIPAWRPTDSWFGPPTAQGELCYAALTAARLHLENLPLRPHRAVTPVLLRNRAATSLNLVRFNLPMPNLSLYADADGYFWTRMVTVERDKSGTLAKVDLGTEPPTAAREPVLVSGPRVAAQKNLFVRALSNLLD